MRRAPTRRCRGPARSCGRVADVVNIQYRRYAPTMPPANWAIEITHALLQLHTAGRDEPQRHRWVDVAARDGPDGVDQGREHETEGKCGCDDSGRVAQPVEPEPEGFGGDADGDDDQDCRADELRQEFSDIEHVQTSVSGRGEDPCSLSANPGPGADAPPPPESGRGEGGWIRCSRWPSRLLPASGWPWRRASFARAQAPRRAPR